MDMSSVYLYNTCILPHVRCGRDPCSAETSVQLSCNCAYGKVWWLTKLVSYALAARPWGCSAVHSTVVDGNKLEQTSSMWCVFWCVWCRRVPHFARSICNPGGRGPPTALTVVTTQPLRRHPPARISPKPARDPRCSSHDVAPEVPTKTAPLSNLLLFSSSSLSIQYRSRQRVWLVEVRAVNSIAPPFVIKQRSSHNCQLRLESPSRDYGQNTPLVRLPDLVPSSHLHQASHKADTRFEWEYRIGVTCLIIAAALLLVTTISAPVIGDIAILKVTLTNKTDLRHSSVTFGTFGHCVLDVAPVQ